MKHFIEWILGTLALAVVSTAAVAAGMFATKHPFETIKSLALAVTQGIGVAIGGLLGSALIMRFQSARDYIKKILKDIK